MGLIKYFSQLAPGSSKRSISVERLCKVLTKKGIPHDFNTEFDVIEFIVGETDPINADFQIVLKVSDEKRRFQAFGFVYGKTLDDSDDFKAVYRFCNEWHAETNLPKVWVDTNAKGLFCEWTWNIGVHFEDDELMEAIDSFIAGTESCINRAIEAGLYDSEKKADDQPKETSGKDIGVSA